MNRTARQDAVFLDAMGLGPVWTLRASTGAALPVELVMPESVMPESVMPESVMPESDTNAAAMAWFDDAAPPSPVTAAALAVMDWSELKTAAAQCTRCDLCRGRKKSVFGRGSQSAVWLVLGSGPSRAGEKLGQPLGADAADLLGNMLLAIGLETERDVYLTTLVKCRPADANGAERDPTSDEVAACRPYLERELALTQAGAIIAIGLDAAGGLLGQAVRGSVHRHGAIPVVVTHHPEQLLLQGQDKAQAWADLCLARSLHGNRT